MIVPSHNVRVVIATKPVDFRKGHDGLMVVAEKELGLDPHSGLIIVFRAKRADRIKVLLWDGSGLVMAYKPAGRFEVCVAEGPGRRDAIVPCAVRSPVRRARLEKGSWPQNTPASGD